MGRGPVCGMMTRRTGGPEGAVGSAGASIGSSTADASAAGGGGAAGAWWTSGAETTGAGAAAASTGATCAGLAIGGATAGGVAGCATATGGRAMTGPTGGLLAMAGAAAGTTMFACGRGSGTTRRGAGGVVWAPVWGCDAAAGEGWATATLGAAAAAGGTDAGGATTAVGRGGAALAAASACLRSRMALSASPGLDTLERSNFGLVSTGCLAAVLLLPPFLKYSRTLSAWSASMELEWVFPVTPIASSASRIGLLFTSSSRARSLIRTLLIRPFSFCFPARLAVHISLMEGSIAIVSVTPEIAEFATQGTLCCVAKAVSHGRFRRRYLRRRTPGCR
jgi:hypothetical protein